MSASVILLICIPAFVAYVAGMLAAPFLLDAMHHFKLWKKIKRSDMDTNPTIEEAFTQVHNAQCEVVTPRIGGLVITIGLFVSTLVLWIVAKTHDGMIIGMLDIISRSQTWILFATFAGCAIIGFVEELTVIFPGRMPLCPVHGLSRRMLIGIMSCISLVLAWWFFVKLGMHAIKVPFFGIWELGGAFIIVFFITLLGTFSSRVIDGIDGLSGGVLAIAYIAYAIIAVANHQYHIAAFSGAVATATFAFLWYNVPPAKWYMGEVGMLPLTVCLALIAFLTDSVLELAIIALPLTVTALSSAIQIVSKKVFKKKVFSVAPLHHALQARGWDDATIVMRYWIVAVISAICGVIIALVG